MVWTFLATVAFVAPAHALIRFGCSQLVVERLDPLVTPGMSPSGHVHQIIGGDSFQAEMDPSNHDLPSLATCTTCEPADDFSNYWTAAMYFRAEDGTFKRVQQKGNVGYEQQTGGMTIYYMQDGLANFEQTSKVTAFAPGFRMIVGDPMASSLEDANQYPQLTYTCLQDMNTRFPETKELPTEPCPAGIMANIRFPTCWDGENLDSPDHMSHVAYPEGGTFEEGAPCPASHPVRLPQLFYETIFVTEEFNDQWPSDGSQPFVFSYGDSVGYGTHGDYMFGWKDDSLQKIMDEPCYVTCSSMVTQDINAMNSCTIPPVIDEDVEGWLDELPGGGNP